MSQTPEPKKDDRPAPDRRPYVTPTLQVFGPVATITGTLSMSGSTMDGGPNNSKT